MSSKLIDRSMIEELRALDNGKGQLVNSLIDMFKASVPDLVQQLKAALEKSDTTAMAKVAHVLRSTSGNLGAARFSQLATEIEEMVLHKSPAVMSESRTRFLEMEKLLPEIIIALEKERSAS